jgi:O-antigen/teichoic acid export membrane protein
VDRAQAPSPVGRLSAVDSVAKGTLINLATRTLGVLGVLLITTITARLGTEVQGAFALFTGVEGVWLALLSGFGVALARRVSHHREDTRALLSAMVLCCVGLGLVSGAVLWAFSRTGPAAYQSLWILALGAPLLLLAPNLSGLWLGAGRMAPMAALSLAPPWLALVLLAVLWVTQQTGLTPVLLSWVVAKVAVAIGLLWVLWRGARLAAPDWPALRAELPFVATIGLTNLISLLNYRVGLFVIERSLGLASTGVYSIAVVAAELLWFVSSSLTQAVYGRIGTPDRAAAAAVTLRALHLSLAALLCVAPLLWALAWWLLPSVLGPAYAASLLPLALLLPGALMFGGASALSAYFTNHAGRPLVPARVAALSLFINAVLAWLLVPRLGMAGAALAASVAYTLSVLVLAVLFARHAGLPLRQVLLPGAALWRDVRALCIRALASRAGGG